MIVVWLRMAPLPNHTVRVHVCRCYCETAVFITKDYVEHLSDGLSSRSSPRPSCAPVPIIPFPKPFFPELRANILDLLDRQDVLNYSLCCREFNAESMRLVWSVLDIPTPVYQSSRGDMLDACRAILRVPERGRYVKKITILCTFSPVLRLPNSMSKEAILDVFGKTMELLPYVHSLSIRRSIADAPSDVFEIEHRNALRIGYFTILHRWSKTVPLKRLQFVYIGIDAVTPFFDSCPNVCHLSLQLTQWDLDRLRGVAMPSGALPLLSTLEADFQCLPFFVSSDRRITNVIVHGAESCQPDVITAAGQALREANTVETLQLCNTPTQAVGHVLSILAPLPSLKTLVERDRLFKYQPDEDDRMAWVHQLMSAVEHVPSLETYIVGLIRMTNTALSRREHAVLLVKYLCIHVPPHRSPALRRIIFEVCQAGLPEAVTWTYHRASDGRWTVTEDLSLQKVWMS